MIETEEAVKFIVDIGRKEKTGPDAEAEYIRVDLQGQKLQMDIQQEKEV